VKRAIWGVVLGVALAGGAASGQQAVPSRQDLATAQPPPRAEPPPSPDAAQVGAQATPAAGRESHQRDPFRPFTLDLRPPDQHQEPLTPLQRYELAQLRVAAVLLDVKPPRALLQDNSGMGFIVTPGTPIGRNHGVVTAIEPRRVIVEEKVLDFYGNEQTQRVVLEMPKDEQPQRGQE
jgi:type IV pilus assembly protein PilP